MFFEILLGYIKFINFSELLARLGRTFCIKKERKEEKQRDEEKNRKKKGIQTLCMLLCGVIFCSSESRCSLIYASLNFVS